MPQGNEQTRVLALVKRHYLTKDQTARLIDWWRNAAEDERLQLEEKYGFPLPPLLDKILFMLIRAAIQQRCCSAQP